MAKVFLGLAIALMIATAVVGFLAKGNIDTIQGNLKDTKSTLATTTSTLKKTEGSLKATQEELAVAKTALDEEKAAVAKAKADLEDAVKKATEAAVLVEAKTKEMADLQAKIAAMSDGDKGIPIEQFKVEMDKVRAELEKAQIQLTESEQIQKTLNARVKETEEKFNGLNSEVNRYRANVAKNGLSGRIMAVNPGWNFVVLSVGDKQGAAVGANMLVLRGGEPIGKAKITSVEPSTSIADIIPGSVRAGITVQAGDSVVYEGQRK